MTETVQHQDYQVETADPAVTEEVIMESYDPGNVVNGGEGVMEEQVSMDIDCSKDITAYVGNACSLRTHSTYRSTTRRKDELLLNDL